MPVKKLIAARNRAIASLDVNGDGVVDHHDAVAAAKITGAAVAGLGVTAITSASLGSAIVASGATAIAAKVTAVAGAAAGGFIAATFGTASATVSILAIGPSSVLLASALLHKWVDGRSSPIPGQTYPTACVKGMPSAVKPFRTATRTWNSAT